MPTATPLAYAVVVGRSGRGVNLRQAPGLTPILVIVPDGTVVQLAGRSTEEAGLGQLEVILPNGWVGWVVEALLVPYQLYQEP